MREILDYLNANWPLIVIPAAVFAVSIIALFWLRKVVLDYLARWARKTKWLEDDMIIQSLRMPASLLCLILSVHLGLAVSSVPENYKVPAGLGLWSLFVAALALGLINFFRSLMLYYGEKYTLPNRVVLLIRNIIQTVIAVIAVLVLMGIWGLPTNPLLLLIAVLILIVLLAFRDAVPNLLASFQIAAMQEIKEGDYVKLDGKEEGYIIGIGWDNTRLKSLDGSTILIPNSQLVRRKIINYGHPLKRAREPFRFNTRVHLAESTGLRAGNLPELAAVLKKMPDPVIYYHTHHFLEEHQYIIPELSNDFANWVKDALGDHVLAERLANISIFEYNNLTAFRDRLVSIVEEYLAQKRTQREADKGREFYFMKSVSVVLPTNYTAHDLREFVESLRRISPSSLYFHIFESRLRLGRETNDFSAWLVKSMDEPDLSRELARIDPYTYTLEGLRSLLIQVIEKRIK
ncbi:MAG: DUF5752 family protein [Dehalococcoidales bacterium]|nr:DUF5752 family protein [Dehalococcoidales bacterium]